MSGVSRVSLAFFFPFPSLLARLFLDLLLDGHYLRHFFNHLLGIGGRGRHTASWGHFFQGVYGGVCCFASFISWVLHSQRNSGAKGAKRKGYGSSWEALWFRCIFATCYLLECDFVVGCFSNLFFFLFFFFLFQSYTPPLVRIGERAGTTAP